MTEGLQVDVKKVYANYAQNGLDSAQQLGWNNIETQAKYMNIMLAFIGKHMDMRGLSIHDAGCGYGDLVTHLEKSLGGPRIASYVGTDLMEASVAKAKKRHGAYHFFSRDLLREEVPEADLTICMGALAFHRTADAMELLERLWQSSRKALAFNCWWNLTPEYVGCWESQKLQKRIERWAKRKDASILTGYEATEAMFVVCKPQ